MIEILIAAFIIVFCFLFMIGVFPTSYKSVANGIDIVYATHVAKMQMDRLMSDYFTENPLSLSDQTASYTVKTNGIDSTSYFLYDVEVSPDDSTLSNLTTKDIIVTVYRVVYNSTGGIASTKEIVKFETKMSRWEGRE